jgi:hypothetical protein
MATADVQDQHCSSSKNQIYAGDSTEFAEWDVGAQSHARVIVARSAWNRLHYFVRQRALQQPRVPSVAIWTTHTRTITAIEWR